MKAEYNEGPKARENFERLAKAVFQAPKPQKKRQPKEATAPHPECQHRGPNRDRIFLRISPMNDEVNDFEPNGEYEESSSLRLGLTMLLVGLAAGALVALLLAPKTGKQMRRTLRRKYEDAREVMEDIGEQAGDWIDKGSEWADKAKSKMPPLKKPFVR